MSRVPATTCGWEMNDITEIGLASGTDGPLPTVVSTNPAPRNGTYCLKCLPGGGENVNFKQVNITIATPVNELYFRFGMWVHFVAASEPTFLQVLSNAPAVLAYLTVNSTDSKIRAYRGDGTLLGVSSAAITANAWTCVDVHIITNATTGVVGVWLNGTQILNLSAQNTNAAAIATFNLACANMPFGAVGTFIAFDDLGVNNTSGTINNGKIGDGKVLLQLPAGVGASTQFTRGGVDSGANWSNVNHVPPNGTTQMVFDGTPGDRDLYTIGALPGNPVQINCVELIANAANSDAGAGSLALTVKSGPTTSQGATQALGTSFAYLRQLYETDPNTTLAWVGANVSSAQIGQTAE